MTNDIRAKPGETAARGATLALAVLAFVNLFNYLDRWVLSAVLQSVKMALTLSDTQLGLLAPGFLIVYMLTAPVFGWLGDRGGRVRLIALGVAAWSVATAAAGLASSFVTLFLARSAVGVGEAAYGTIAPALLADAFPKARRGRIFAIFFAAIPIGSALAYVLGGLVDKHYGWRAAFYIAGLPGLLLALLCLAIRDPPRGQMDAPDASPDASPKADTRAPYRVLLANPAYVLTVLGYAAYTFAIGGIAFWMPAFLERERGFDHSAATVQFGAIIVVTGFLGTFGGGWLGDALLKRTRQAYLWVSGVATLAAAPCALWAFTATDHQQILLALFLAEILMFTSTGPVNSAIVNVVAPEMRASAVALSILSIHLLGDIVSPPLIGRISDLSSLAAAVLIVPVAVVISGVIWCAAAVLGNRRGWTT